MPEGPEVECVRKNLLSLVDKQVRRIELTELSQKYPKYQDKQSLFVVFSGSKLETIDRKGKFLIWKFSTKPVILNHLGMSGKWLIDPGEGSYTHPKVIIEFEDGKKAIFDDVRNFGQFLFYTDYNAVLKHHVIKNLGVDGLETPFDMDRFLKLLDHPRYAKKEVGEALLDQRLAAGVGNIYKSESLFLAGIHPARKVSKLTIKKREKLGRAISETLHKALECNGSTFGTQPYLLPSGESGEAQNWHAVYGREGEECQTCREKIIRLIQKDRSTFYCPKCQK